MNPQAGDVASDEVAVPAALPAPDDHTFPGEQRLLEPEELLAVAEPGAAVAAERPVAGDHAVARDEQTDRVAPDRAAHRPRGARCADPARDLAVRDCRAPGNAPDPGEHPAIPLRDALEGDGNSFQGAGPPAQVRMDRVLQGAEDRARPRRRGRIPDGDEPAPGAGGHRGTECLAGRAQLQRHDPVRDGAMGTSFLAAEK